MKEDIEIEKLGKLALMVTQDLSNANYETLFFEFSPGLIVRPATLLEVKKIPSGFDAYLISMRSVNHEEILRLRIYQPNSWIFGMDSRDVTIDSVTRRSLDGLYDKITREEYEEIYRKVQNPRSAETK